MLIWMSARAQDIEKRDAGELHPWHLLTRVLKEEGSTIRLFKEVYRQGGEFLRRDWCIGEP